MRWDVLLRIWRLGSSLLCRCSTCSGNCDITCSCGSSSSSSRVPVQLKGDAPNIQRPSANVDMLTFNSKSFAR